MQVSSEIRDGVAFIKIFGRLMFDESLLSLRHEVRELLREGIKSFVLDLSEVPHCDSSGTGEAIGVYTSISKAGGMLVIAGLTERVKTLWGRVKLLDVFNIFSTVAEAEAFIRRVRPKS